MGKNSIFKRLFPPSARRVIIKISAVSVLLIVIGFVVLAEMTQLPDNSDKPVSHVIKNGADTLLGKTFAPLLEKHLDQSAVHLLSDGRDAFVGRAILARQAERSIDVQYYMFHQDAVGKLLINELLNASDRGVRVRLLVDDMYGSEADDIWLGLDSHPDFEVRLFNPFARNHSRNLQFVTHLKRVNHRMHSKSFTVDDQATIIGGRNIGDEYFNADKNLAFSDLDVMAIGPAAHEVSSEFDSYWNSEHAYPITTLNPPVEPVSLDMLRKDMKAFFEGREASDYVQALHNSTFASQLKDHQIVFYFARTRVIHDSPEKLEKSDDWKDGLLITQLAPYIEEAKEDFILVSPYFVPGRAGTKALCDLVRRGVRVRVLTNSLASNDVTAVHTGYIRHRRDLLDGGVELYELNEQLKSVKGELYTWLPRLDKSSLHAKTMVIDGRIMFVGSFNFDPRSMHLNNEIGILFYEPNLAGKSAQDFDARINEVAFRLELVPGRMGSKNLCWIGYENGRKVILDDEPYAGFLKKSLSHLMRILPVDSLL